jgi:Host cell surface-exposed lipoprotein
MSEQYSHLTGGPAAPQTPPPAPGWQPEPPRKRRRGLKITLAVIAMGTASLITLGVVGQNSSGSSASAAKGGPDLAQCTTNCPTPAGNSNPFSDSDPSNDPNYQPSGSGNNWGVTEQPAAPQPTVAQEQALESAESYLDMGGFSKAGLIDQLHSSAGEGFKMSDARWAVNHTHANWNHQAVLSAKSYLEMGGFSRASLIDQLSSSAGEGFTLAQATYAANQVGL